MKTHPIRNHFVAVAKNYEHLANTCLLGFAVLCTPLLLFGTPEKAIPATALLCALAYFGAWIPAPFVAIGQLCSRWRLYRNRPELAAELQPEDRYRAGLWHVRQTTMDDESLLKALMAKGWTIAAADSGWHVQHRTDRGIAVVQVESLQIGQRRAARVRCVPMFSTHYESHFQLCLMAEVLELIGRSTNTHHSVSQIPTFA